MVQREVPLGPSQEKPGWAEGMAQAKDCWWEHLSATVWVGGKAKEKDDQSDFQSEMTLDDGMVQGMDQLWGQMLENAWDRMMGMQNQHL